MSMNNYTKYWFLEGFDFFKKLNKKQLMSISNHVGTIYAKKGDILHFTHDENSEKLVYFLKTGAVKIVQSPKGKTKSILNRGNLFGYLEFYEDHESNDEAIVLKDSNICFVTASYMKDLIESNSNLKNELLKIKGIKIKKLEVKLDDLLYKDSVTRIVDYMIDYVKNFGKEMDGYWVAENLISHKDIANLTNTSRQTVSNVLSNLRKEKLLDYDYEQIKFTSQSIHSIQKIKHNEVN